MHVPPEGFVEQRREEPSVTEDEGQELHPAPLCTTKESSVNLVRKEPVSAGEGDEDPLPLQASREEVIRWQQRDPTLTRARGCALPQDLEKGAVEGAYFYYRDGLLYRHWHPAQGQEQDVRACEQLVLPQECRPLVLQLAHDVPMSGHLGTTKTKDRILQRYYWPGVFRDAATYCRTCEVCQRGRPARAHLIPNQVEGNAKCQEACQRLKDALGKGPVLWIADPSEPFILQTDASERGLEAVLSQEDTEGFDHPVAFISRKLLPREQNYATVEKECLAIV